MDSLIDKMTGSFHGLSIELAQSICPWLTERTVMTHKKNTLSKHIVSIIEYSNAERERGNTNTDRSEVW